MWVLLYGQCGPGRTLLFLLHFKLWVDASYIPVSIEFEALCL